jgi:hypothetical protein
MDSSIVRVSSFQESICFSSREKSQHRQTSVQNRNLIAILDWPLSLPMLISRWLSFSSNVTISPRVKGILLLFHFCNSFCYISLARTFPHSQRYFLGAEIGSS